MVEGTPAEIKGRAGHAAGCGLEDAFVELMKENPTEELVRI